MASIIKADDQAGIISSADATGTLELQATSGLVTLENIVGGMVIPKGTTAQRPSSPIIGTLRYNSSSNAIEVYINNEWLQLSIVNTNNVNYLYNLMFLE